MTIGKMRHRISLESVGRTSDDAGGFSSGWDEAAEIWAHVKPASARENFRDMQLAEEKTYEVTIRYRDNASASQRIKFGTRIFNIRQVRNRDERSRYLDILCEEGVAT